HRTMVPPSETRVAPHLCAGCAKRAHLLVFEWRVTGTGCGMKGPSATRAPPMSIARASKNAEKLHERESGAKRLAVAEDDGRIGARRACGRQPAGEAADQRQDKRCACKRRQVVCIQTEE